MYKLATAAALVLGFASSASAMTYSGNPDLDFKIDRTQSDFVDGDVYLTKVKIHNCNGSSTVYSVGKWIDPVAGYPVHIQGGDLCGASWYWGSDMDIDGVGFTLEITDNSTYASLDPIKGVPMLNWSVVSGDMPGSNGPRIYPYMN